MSILFDTPFAVIIAFLALLALSAPSVSKNKWARICKYLVIIFLGYCVLTANSALVRKGEYGSRKHEAHLVSKFTENINALVSSGQSDRAQKLLFKFTEEYPVVAGRHTEAEEFLNLLIVESAANQTIKADEMTAGGSR